MFVPVSASEVSSFSKVGNSRMQTRESEGLVVRRLLYLTNFLHLKFDFSFLFYLFQHRAMSDISDAVCCSSLLTELFHETFQFRRRHICGGTGLGIRHYSIQLLKSLALWMLNNFEVGF